MISTPGDSGDWQKPLAALKEGIEKLRALAVNESDPAKKTELSSKIQDLETRADKFLKIMQLQGRG